MKKIFVSLAVMFLVASSVSAQISAGLGFLNQSYRIKDSNLSSNTLNGFYMGAGYTYPLSASFSLVPAVYYGYTTGEVDIFNLGLADIRTDNHTLAIPINVKYGLQLTSFIEGFVFAGPRFDIGLASSTKVSTIIGNSSYSIDNYGENGYMQRFDLSLGVGIGFDFSKLARISFAYDWGMLDISKSESYKLHRNSWRIGIAYLF